MEIKKLISISESLFNAFANAEYYSPQADSQLWAIIEGIRRVDPNLSIWQPGIAYKDEKCVTGCKIKKDETYFLYQVDYSRRNKIKFCAQCTAMILYFLKVEYLHYHKYTHWDTSSNRPINKLTFNSTDAIKTYSMEKIRVDYPRAHEKWTPEEEKRMILLFKSGSDIKSISVNLERHPSSIRSRLKKLGLLK